MPNDVVFVVQNPKGPITKEISDECEEFAECPKSAQLNRQISQQARNAQWPRELIH